ncbi:MAG: LysR family transcriptional regulator [Shimia sp.]
MNKAPIAFDWNQSRAVLAAAEAGSFSAAARALGLTQPTLSRQVAAFEAASGVTVFERVGHGLLVTEAGEQVLAHLRQMGEAALRAAIAASGQANDVSGEVRVSVSDVAAAVVLPPIIARLRTIAPSLRIVVIATNTLSDLERREADIAVRHVRPTQPNLTARLIQEGTARFYGARDYLDRFGRPRSYAELAGHHVVCMGDLGEAEAYLRNIGVPVTGDTFSAASPSGLAVWGMAQAGLGLCPMSDVIAARDAGMEAVALDEPPIRFPVWLTTHRELHTSRRIRLVFDALAAELRV